MHISTFGGDEDAATLLLHGGGVAGWMWEPMRTHLPTGRRLIVPDLPGHGRSADQDYESHDATIDQLVRVIRRERRPVHVVGFSLGAQLAVLLAARHPDLVDHVVVISAQTVPLRAPGLMVSLLHASAGLAKKEWFARMQASALFVPDELMTDYVRTSASISRTTLVNSVRENIAFTVPESWESCARPALILVGAREKPLMKRSASVLHDRLPSSTIEMVDDCGHGIPLQRPEWLAQRIRSWCDGGRA